jgi:Na+/melibiose symporter-like transporter
MQMPLNIKFFQMLTHLFTAVFELGLFCWFGSSLITQVWVAICKTFTINIAQSVTWLTVYSFTIYDTFTRGNNVMTISYASGLLPVKYGQKTASSLILSTCSQKIKKFVSEEFGAKVNNAACNG